MKYPIDRRDRSRGRINAKRKDLRSCGKILASLVKQGYLEESEFMSVLVVIVSAESHLSDKVALLTDKHDNVIYLKDYR